MTPEEALPSSFIRDWVAHELAQYGAEPAATYLAENTDPVVRVLVATDVGVLDLKAERSGPHSNSTYTLGGRLHPWHVMRDLDLTTETHLLSSHSEDHYSLLHLSIPALGLSSDGDSPDGRGQADFARACVKAIASEGRSLKGRGASPPGDGAEPGG